MRESWGLRQGNTAFNTIWAGGEWTDAQCIRCRAWEMQVGAACEPAMWLDASACFDDSQAAADAAIRAVEQSEVRFVGAPLATDMKLLSSGFTLPRLEFVTTWCTRGGAAEGPRCHGGEKCC